MGAAPLRSFHGDGAAHSVAGVKPPLSVTTSNLNAHMLRTAERQALEHASLVDPRVSEPAADRIRMSVMTTIESEHSREDLRDSSRSSILLEEGGGPPAAAGPLITRRMSEASEGAGCGRLDEIEPSSNLRLSRKASEPGRDLSAFELSRRGSATFAQGAMTPRPVDEKTNLPSTPSSRNKSRFSLSGVMRRLSARRSGASNEYETPAKSRR